MSNAEVLTKGKQNEVSESDSKNNLIKAFNNPEFGNIRCITISGEPWFVGKDLANALKYSNSRDAISKVDDEDKRDDVAFRDAIGRTQKMILVNESGLYSLIFSSKLKKAKEFKHWVTAVVLPSIRKTGKYALSDHIREELETRRAEALARLEEARVAELAARTENSRVYLRCLDFLPRKFHEQHETLLGLAANTAAGRRVISFDGIPDLNIDCATHDEDCPVSLQYDDSPIPYFL